MCFVCVVVFLCHPRVLRYPCVLCHPPVLTLRICVIHVLYVTHVFCNPSSPFPSCLACSLSHARVLRHPRVLCHPSASDLDTTRTHIQTCTYATGCQCSYITKYIRHSWHWVFCTSIPKFSDPRFYFALRCMRLKQMISVLIDWYSIDVAKAPEKQMKYKNAESASSHEQERKKHQDEV